MTTNTQAAALRVGKLTFSALYTSHCAGASLTLSGTDSRGGHDALPRCTFPALLCGFVCGWPWGLAVGFISLAAARRDVRSAHVVSHRRCHGL